ncbi:unnamed protein product, partial [Iphiclides podalirius]
MVPYAISGANGVAMSAANHPNMATSGSLTGHGMQPANIPYSSVYAQSPSGTQTANYLANTNMANAITNANMVNSRGLSSGLEYGGASGLVHGTLASSSLAANAANANAVANAVNTANAIISADNMANNIINAYENVLANAEDTKLINPNNPSPVLNGNMATFYLGNNGNTFTVTSGSPGSQGVGVQVMADALEVGGTVAVNGRIPIYGIVGINGNVPTDGMASVSYSCANPSNLLYTNL